MRKNWVLAAIVAVGLAVPFALALREDRSGKPGGSGTLSDPSPSNGTLSDDSDPSNGTLSDDSVPLDGGKAEAGGWKLAESPDRRFYDSVLLAGDSATRPVLTGALEGLQLGMTRDEARVAAPAATEWQRTGRLPDFPDASLWLEFKGAANTLSSALVSFPDEATALPILIAAWGEPDHVVIAQDDPGGSGVSPTNDGGRARLARGRHPGAIWFDDTSAMRTVVTHWPATKRSAVVFARYMPTNQLIAPKSQLFGFESRRILGSTKDAVLRAYADRIVADSRSRFKLPLAVTEYGSEPQQVDIYLNGDRVTRVEFSIDHHLSPGAHVEILDLLEAKLGEPIESKPGGRVTVFSRRGDKITVERRADTTLLVVSMERG